MSRVFAVQRPSTVVHDTFLKLTTQEDVSAWFFYVCLQFDKIFVGLNIVNPGKGRKGTSSL